MALQLENSLKIEILLWTNFLVYFVLREMLNIACGKLRCVR